MSIDNGIATIDIVGPLGDDVVPIEKAVGVTDYRDIIADVTAAIQQGAKGILLRVDSPGGTVVGAREAYESIAKTNIPVVAYVDGLATSAAYMVSVGADYIVSRPSANVGNIGSIFVMYDDGKLLERMGIERFVFTNEEATLKSAGYGLTDEQRAFLQEWMNHAGNDFRAMVSANREVDDVVYKAGWYYGDTALSLNLIDELGDLNLAYQRLAELIAAFGFDTTIIETE
jgi:protease-4